MKKIDEIIEKLNSIDGALKNHLSHHEKYEGLLFAGILSLIIGWILK